MEDEADRHGEFLDMMQMQDGPFDEPQDVGVDFLGPEETFDEEPPENDAPENDVEALAPELPVTSTPVRRVVASAHVLAPQPALPAESQRKRLRRKTTVPEHHVLKASASAPPHISFLRHPALIQFLKLPSKEQQKLHVMFRVRRTRCRDKLARHEPVEIGERTFTVAEDMHLQAELQKADMHALLLDANNPELSMEHRGGAMHRYMKLQGQPAEAGPAGLGDSQTAKAHHKSMLLTYNGDWGLFPRQEHTSSRMEDVVAWLRDEARIEELVDDRVTWCLEEVRLHRIREWALSVEVSPETLGGQEPIRVHIHVWLLLGSAGCEVDRMHFRGSKPYINTEYSLRNGVRSRASQGHFVGAFYLSVQKVGMVAQRMSIRPFLDYPVKDFWITNLYIGEKIAGDEAERLYVKSVVRAETNLRQLRFVETERKKQKLLEIQRQTDAQLRALQKPFHSLDIISTWLSQYSRLQGRYKFLVLQGPSCTGKTKFAMSLTKPGNCYYADCSGGVPDMRSFDWFEHDLVLFDEMSPCTAIDLKKLIQASNELCVLGASPTLQHCYPVYGHRTKFVICTNTWEVGMADKKMTPEDVAWLMENSFLYVADKPLFMT